jgi:methylase of polypeptide subunit release factors
MKSLSTQDCTRSTPDGELAVREDAALIELVELLRGDGYQFTTVTPLTQARVNRRQGNHLAMDLAGVFGWSRPFHRNALPNQILTLMSDANALDMSDRDRWRSRIRVSTLGTQLFVHSAYPTEQPNAVFFGPDTVRFVHAIERHLNKRTRPVGRVADVGCGAGPGGIAISAAIPNADVLMLDINALAVRYARVNAAINRVSARSIDSDILDNTTGCFDLIVSNPPYLIDEKARAYRHGGGRFGEGLSIEILRQSLARLSVGGTLLLYTGSAITSGIDGFSSAAHDLLQSTGLRWSYAEIDPDVFGEELEMAAYATADRIAAVLLTVTREEQP